MNCEYCNIEMDPGRSTLAEANGWHCTTCKHEEVEWGSYKLAGSKGLVLPCRCKNCSNFREGALAKTLYHHPESTPAVIEMATGKTFNTPPPVPTEKEKRYAGAMVENLIAEYVRPFRFWTEASGEDS